MTAPVLFEELACHDGNMIAIASLNSEKTLNALTLEMVELIFNQLQRWENNDAVKVIFLQGKGEKAFCAGGDVQAMRLSSLQQPGGPCEYAETFFEKEYRLDYMLHNYPKPIVIWGHGIVMGGGLGLFAACSHRVVTEKTRIAMPEVSIALFPDVGGSYFLNRMPGYCGRFLALTAASINAADSLYVGLSDFFINNQQKQQLIDNLQLQRWSDDYSENHKRLSALLAAFQQTTSTEMAEGKLAYHQQLIDQLCSGDDVIAIANRIAAIRSDDQWLLRARKGLLGGSPLAIKWIFKQLKLCEKLSLKDVFQSELALATNIMRGTEFAEGVRALLVDKDQSPQWQFSSLSEVDDAIVDGFFELPWPQNPLVDL